jgi:hypothetical protein
MSEIFLSNVAPLQPFRINIRNKEGLKSILYKLEVTMYGWNLPILLDKYCMKIDQSFSEEYHRGELIRLIAILLSADNTKLIDDPTAVFCENKISGSFFRLFLSQFIDELKIPFCDDSYVGPKPVFGTGPYAQQIHAYMTSIIYSKMRYRNPAIPGIAAFILLVLANTYATSFCRTPTTTIVENLVGRLGLAAGPMA